MPRKLLCFLAPLLIAFTLSAALVDAQTALRPAYTFSFSVAAGAANVAEITITPKALGRSSISGVHTYDLWLSDSATCAGLTAVTASGAVTNKAASGIVLDTYTAKKSLRVQTLATGVFVLSVTDTAKSPFRICASSPSTGLAVIGPALVTASYG